MKAPVNHVTVWMAKVRKHLRGMRKFRYLLLPAVCIPVTLLLFQTVLLIGYVPSTSMEPTLKKDSLILGLRLYGDFQTGDIVIFRHEGRLLVKRIAAGPGEKIDHDGTQVTVPENCYYLLGDNSDGSYDSRYWEQPFVKAEDIVAKLIETKQFYEKTG